MSLSAKLLKIAELRHEGKTYQEVIDYFKEQGLEAVSRRTIKEVEDMIRDGIIKFTEEGKAYTAKPPELKDIHDQVVNVVMQKATEEALRMAEEDYLLGKELRQYWEIKAREAGMTLREYIKAALIFYEDYKDEIEKLEELREIARTMFEVLQTETVKKKRMELYYKFIGFCLTLKAQGYTVPQQVINDFVADLNLLSSGKTIKLPFMEET